MGKPSDPMAVVDSNLKVRKVTGLRIADGTKIESIAINGL